MASNNTQFITKGKVDLSVETPTITSTATSSYIELKLKDVATENAGDIITLYMMVAPVDMSNSVLTFTVFGNGGASYSQTLSAGKNMVAGKAYNYAVSLDKDDSQYVAVDLGLPSGLKWASFNVGATAPEEYGDYYAWGEVTTKLDYSQENYEHFHIERGVDADGFEIEEHVWVDLGNISGTGYDVAHDKWGGSWRMPTQSEFDELYNCCTWKWGAKNTVYGYKVTGSNGNWIFLPAAGHRSYTQMYYEGLEGKYWSSEQEGSVFAYILDFWVGNLYLGSRTDRIYGFSVRPVTE